MQTLSLILLPWIVYGILSLVGWWSTGINIAVSFIVEGIYMAILVLIDYLVLKYGDDREPETALERARRIIG